MDIERAVREDFCIEPPFKPTKAELYAEVKKLREINSGLSRLLERTFREVKEIKDYWYGDTDPRETTYDYDYYEWLQLKRNEDADE